MPLKKQSQQISLRELTSTDDTVYTILQEHEMVEKKLLGTILLSPGALGFCGEELIAEDFHSNFHQELFRKLIELYVNKEVIDVVNLVKFFSASALTELLSQAGSIIEAKDLGMRIKEAAIIRKLYTGAFEQINRIIRKKNVSEIIAESKKTLDESTKKITYSKEADARSIIKKLTEERNLIKEKKPIIV